jgi:hypothetical protein
MGATYRLNKEQVSHIMSVIAQELEVRVGDLIEVGGERYKVNEGGLSSEARHTLIPDGILEDIVLAELLLGKATYTIPAWEPHCGDRYYSPCPRTPSGVGSYVYGSDVNDVATMERVGIYRTEEEALQEARELGWVE